MLFVDAICLHSASSCQLASTAHQFMVRGFFWVGSLKWTSHGPMSSQYARWLTLRNCFHRPSEFHNTESKFSGLSASSSRMLFLACCSVLFYFGIPRLQQWRILYHPDLCRGCWLQTPTLTSSHPMMSTCPIRWWWTSLWCLAPVDLRDEAGPWEWQNVNRTESTSKIIWSVHICSNLNDAQTHHIAPPCDCCGSSRNVIEQFAPKPHPNINNYNNKVEYWKHL